jgi:hypothetical protein
MADSLVDSMVIVRNIVTELNTIGTSLYGVTPTNTTPSGTYDAFMKARLAVNNLGNALMAHPATPKSVKPLLADGEEDPGAVVVEEPGTDE